MAGREIRQAAEHGVAACTVKPQRSRIEGVDPRRTAAPTHRLGLGGGDQPAAHVPAAMGLGDPQALDIEPPPGGVAREAANQRAAGRGGLLAPGGARGQAVLVVPFA